MVCPIPGTLPVNHNEFDIMLVTGDDLGSMLIATMGGAVLLFDLHPYERILATRKRAASDTRIY